ncbi:hypothetical protein [Fluviicola sp.]|uniref:hypothetical protein n=1 Tax=Fluviicola sp. TaxID=1917219 RepID=UPI0028263A7E|nr:hypothetical protein [Fluviicola sp.]MDR0800911.1 hypothetical protein [Fluviicola sp.]
MNDQDINSVYRQQRSLLLTKIERYKREIEEDERKVKALEILIGEENYSILSDHYDNDEQYPFTGTYADKIKFVISEKGSATAKDISNEIIRIEQIDTTEDENRVKLNVTLNASRLYKEGVLEVDKAGNANIYSLAGRIAGNLLSMMSK